MATGTELALCMEGIGFGNTFGEKSFWRGLKGIGQE